MASSCATDRSEPGQLAMLQAPPLRPELLHVQRGALALSPGARALCPPSNRDVMFSGLDSDTFQHGDLKRTWPAQWVFTASELQSVSSVLADRSRGLTRSEIGKLLSLLGMNDPTPSTEKRRRLYNAFVKCQNDGRSRGAILEFIRHALRPARHAKEQQRLDSMRANLLTAVGLVVEASGELTRIPTALALAEATRRAEQLRAELKARDAHPDVLRLCRAELVADSYLRVVLEANRTIFDKLRSKTGFTEHGLPLVERAFAGDSPKLALNELSTESQKSEQRSFANLIRATQGIFGDPTARDGSPHWAMPQQDAQDLLLLASTIHRRLDEARVR